MSLWRRIRRELRVRALLAALPLLRVLPLQAGALLGALAWSLSPRQRRLAREQLAIAFPEKSPKERDRIGQASFANLGRSALETARSEASEVEVPAAEEAIFRAAHAQGKGVVVASAHLGSWELFARRMAALGPPCAVVAKEAQDPRLTALLERTRSGAGLKIFWRGSTFSAREVLRFLESGGVVGILIDQDTKVAGHFVPFFGRPAFTPRAAGDLAAISGAPMLFGCVHRMGPGHRVTLRKIDPLRSGDRDADSLALTAEATRVIEEEIRTRPDEWVWMHPRWRTQPSEIAREK
jgi:KDO2-lipid IV(A) lauroyltransferase